MGNVIPPGFYSEPEKSGSKSSIAKWKNVEKQWDPSISKHVLEMHKGDYTLATKFLKLMSLERKRRLLKVNQTILKNNGPKCLACPDIEGAYDKLRKNIPKWIDVDHELPGGNIAKISY